MNIATAIQNKRLLSFLYDGFPRIVEPHTVGIDTKGHMALRAYQVGGRSDSGEDVGWKLFHVHEMRNVQVLLQSFSSPRAGYKREDKAFSSIAAQL